ncbi:MAG: DUF2059 domain-containing protein [Magnetococcales bacterium]|nr:DUF2059 domain-containing protein [Magnetococcales bacterium]
MKKVCLVLLLFMVVPASTSFAAGPSQSSIDRLFVAQNIQESMKDLISLVTKQADSMALPTVEKFFGTAKPSSQQVKIYEEYVATIIEKRNKIMAEHFSWEVMKPVYVKVYQEAYTQDEIDAMIAFYESKAGKSSTAKAAIVMQKTTELLQPSTVKMMQLIQTAVKETVQEISNKYK